jgi:hypothetical protein
MSLESNQSIGAIQFTVGYAATGSTFDGTGTDVYCVSLIDDDSLLLTFNNVVDAAQLHVGLVTMATVDGPLDLAACSFRPTRGEFDASAFDVVVVDAVDGNNATIDVATIDITVDVP